MRSALQRLPPEGKQRRLCAGGVPAAAADQAASGVREEGSEASVPQQEYGWGPGPECGRLAPGDRCRRREQPIADSLTGKRNLILLLGDCCSVAIFTYGHKEPPGRIRTEGCA
jgi:hypothetical protein